MKIRSRCVNPDLGRVLLWAFGLAAVGGLVATAPFLASNNLLPRREFVHAAALICLALNAVQKGTLSTRWLMVAGGVVAAWLLSNYRQASVPGFVDALGLVALVIGLGSARLGRTQVLRIIVFTCGAAALWGLTEQWLPLDWGTATRPAGLFASRVTAGAMMAAAIPMTCLVLAHRPKTQALLLCLEVAFLISTRTRVAWVAAALVMAALVIVAPRLRKVLTWAAVGALALALAVTPGPRLHWNSPSPYADSIVDTFSLHVGDRIDLWRETARLTVLRPGGYGPGSFEPSFDALARDLPASLNEVQVESPHNEFLRLAYEFGVPLLILLVVAAWPKRGRASSRTRMLQLSLGALAICSMTGKTLVDPPTAMTAAILLGLLSRSTGRMQASTLAWLLPLALGALMVATDVPALRSSRALAEAQGLARAGDQRAAWEREAPFLDHNPDLNAWRWAIELMRGTGDRRRCLDLSEQALSLFPRHRLVEAGRRACGQ